VRYLNVGNLVRGVTDDVARAWPTVEAEAQRAASVDGMPPVAWVRTDRGAFGSISILPDFPVTFAEEGQPNDPEFGTIIQASADLDQVSSAAAAAREPEPERSDAEVQDQVRGLRADRPELDWDNLLMGRLAGPPSPSRPNVPVWDYLTFANDNPAVLLGDLTAVRFPVRYFEGPWDVTSIDEWLKPFPSSYQGTPPKPRFAMTAETVISRYAALHEAGLIQWDPEQRGIVYLQPLSSQRKALQAWAQTLDRPEKEATPPATAEQRSQF
jgi:hypothetical protein